MLTLHRPGWTQWVAVAALVAGIAIGCGWPDEPLGAEAQREPTDAEVAQRAFSYLSWEHGLETAQPTMVRVLTVDAAGNPVPGAEISCLEVHTRSDASGRAECLVRASDDQWPIYVRGVAGGLYGQERSVGGGAETRLVLRSPLKSGGRVVGEFPYGATVDAYGTNWSQRVPVVNDRFELARHPATRTFLRVLRGNPVGDAPVDVLGTAVAEVGEDADIPVGRPGWVRFHTVSTDGPPDQPISAWVDRHAVDLGYDADGYLLELSPGEHVLVINARHGRERHEAKFHVGTAATTDLGTRFLQ